MSGSVIAFVLVVRVRRHRFAFAAGLSAPARDPTHDGSFRSFTQTARHGNRSPSFGDAVPNGRNEPQPTSADTLFEIGVVLALHLAFALAVLVTLDAFGDPLIAASSYRQE